MTIALDPRNGATVAKRGLFFRLARRYTPVIAVQSGDGRFMVSTEDSLIGFWTFVLGDFPDRTMAKFAAVLRAHPELAGIVRGREAVEIGANIGMHTLSMREQLGVAGVLAIEPEPQNFLLLQHNVLANDRDNHVRLLHAALSDHEGEVSLALHPDVHGGHSVQAMANGAHTVAVPSLRFDTLVARGDIDLERTGLVWLDTQGHEGHILAGASLLLESGIPIVMEYWPSVLREAGTLDALHALIATHFTHVIDLHANDDRPPELVATSELPQLERRSGWLEPGTRITDAFTDLVLAPGLGPVTTWTVTPSRGQQLRTRAGAWIRARRAQLAAPA
jgi:FkbM family methyltransferase